MSIVSESNIPHLKIIHKGKVRDIYELDASHLLIVTTDRLSAFDVVLPQSIPNKGEVLTRLATFWFQRTNQIISNHLTDYPIEKAIPDEKQRKLLGNRVIVVKKLKPLPIEAIVRGYIIGSGWAEYKKTGEICGEKLSENLRLAEKLPEPIFTPSTKASVGQHDENISFDLTKKILGDELATQVKNISLKIYKESSAYALERGIIIADTKFEFGLDENKKLYLIDEVLTPDSSRFWPLDQYEVGISPPSFDKQFVRDYLETLDWDKTYPGPSLNEEIINKTSKKYLEAEKRLIESKK
tara:strand:+ start:9637 stop:10527 length:891 start_codon:yes stop_codon:yes gene_type:complete